MENKQLSPVQAFEVVFTLTGQLTLNRENHAVLDGALRTLAGLIPTEEKEPIVEA